MRKFLSLILSLIILLSSFSQGLISFASSDASVSDLYDFADDLSALIRDYGEENYADRNDVDDVMASVDRFFANSVNNEDVLPLSHFETKRLIVKSHRKIDELGAVECVSGYNDLYILQYDSMLSAKTAYEKYLTLNYVEYVEVDTIYSVCEDTLPGEIIDEDNISGFDDVTAVIVGRGTNEEYFDSIALLKEKEAMEICREKKCQKL